MPRAGNTQFPIGTHLTGPLRASLKTVRRPSLTPVARGALQRRGPLLPRCVVQVASTSDVMMAALAQLAEQAATSKNGSAEPHLLRPLPYLIYLADGDTVRGPSPPPVPPSPLPRRPLAAPSAACRGPAPALPHSLPFPPAEAGARQLQRLPERRGAQARDESLQATPRGRLLPSAGGLQGGGRKQRRARPL